MKKQVFVLLLCLWSSLIIAQNKSLSIGRIFGKVVDKSTQQPLAFASVAIFQTVNKKDSLVAGMLTKENGEFSIGDLAFGRYKVKISTLAFKDFMQNIAVSPPENVEVDMGNIALEVDNKILKTVEITTEKSTTQWAIDRKIVNVDKNLQAQAGSIADVLKSVPSVTIDGEGAVLLRNQSPLTYIDGRPTPLSISQIPANQIEQIEVITNPSAKYEAAAAGGIINLVMKKNKHIGLNGNYALGVGTGNRYAGMANLNFKENPFNITFFLNANTSSFPVNGYNDRIDKLNGKATSYNYQYLNNELSNQILSSRINVDYAVNIRNTISLMAATTLARTVQNETQSFEISDAAKQKLAYGNRFVDWENLASDYVISGTWRRTFLKKGRELISNFTYNWGKVIPESDFTTQEYSAQLRQKPLLQRNRGTIDDAQSTFTLDYYTPINDSTKLETGLRSFWNPRSNLFNSDTLSYLTDTYQTVPFLNYDYNYENIINAAYINVLGKLKNNWSYQAGFRYEQSNFTGTSNIDKQDFSYAYPADKSSLLKTLFPSIYLNKKVNATTEWQLNFSRKIGRPTYTQITPFINFADRNSMRIGNPAIRPEFINLAEINYNKTMGKANILSALYFRLVNDPIVLYVYSESNEPNLLITTFVNGSKNRAYGLDNTFKYAFSKNVEWTTNINIFNTYFAYQNLTNTGWAWNGKTILTAKLPKDWTGQLSGTYETPTLLPQGTRGGFYFADMSIRKDLFKKTGALTFIVSDLLNTKKMHVVYDTPQYFNDLMRRRETRYFRITFQKRFGKLDASVFKPKRAGNKSVREQSSTED